MTNSVWIGYDRREADAYAVARFSLKRKALLPYPVRGLMLDELRRAGLYTRPTEVRDGRLWDTISEAPMSTEFACSRFLVPFLAASEGWALFVDSDVLFRADVGKLFRACGPSKAVMCVKHRHEPPEGVKMDGQAQLRYARKNWSSVMAFNLSHPANKRLTLEMVNSRPGRDLHAFCWLEDNEIGDLGQEWNWLVGHSDPAIDPKIVHFTDGIPTMPGYETCAYADEWRATLEAWVQ
jgi:hypothetical protein